MVWFWLGLSLGVLLTVPLAAWAAHRTARRVRRLEQQARTSERLAELGMLTGGLAHEIKNPLSTVGLNIQLLQEDLDHLQKITTDENAHEQLPRVTRRLAGLARETDRLKQILEDFLRFAGRMKLDRQSISLNQLIEEVVDFFAPQAQQAGVRIHGQYTSASTTVQADASLLKQALLNLLINAVQAMSDAREKKQAHGGASELIVRTERKPDPHRPKSAQLILIHIIDTGPGIAPDTLAKIFQPYFSTKKMGTGLGLPTTRRILEEHGGHITVHSDLGKGSDFTLTLPADASSD